MDEKDKSALLAALLRDTKRVAYGALVVINVALGAFYLELGAGNVPIPEEYRWLTPIVSAAIVALCAMLPRLNGGGGSDVAPPEK